MPTARARTSLKWLALTAALASTLGCARAASREDRLLAELESVRAEAAAQSARVALLEQKLTEFEKRRVPTPGQREFERKLDRLVELNERLLERAQPASLEPSVTPAGEGPALASEASFATTADNPRLEVLGRLQDVPRSEGARMSFERRQALRVLQKRERVLDTQNPY
jgi:hypothetical protein